MIPNKTDTHEVASNLDGHQFDMTIEATAMVHIMDVLAKLYSDRPMAVLREYATNARDSHIQAGKRDVPIEITLPNDFAPFLKIKDQGVGLNPSEIETIYSRYGASTKRMSNDVTGHLGFGCKAALAYTNQFTLVATKDGVMTSVSVSRNENGVGNMTIVDTSATDEPNGVEVIVPVKSSDAHEFAERAERLFKYWPAGTVLVNGKQPAGIEGLEVDEGLYLVQGEYDSYVVMGNVPYRIDRYNHRFDGMPYNWGVVAYVPMGSVEHTPSREELTFSKPTREELARVQAKLSAGILRAVQRDIDAAPTHQDALRSYLKWTEFIPPANRKDFTYKGRSLPTAIDARDDGLFVVSEGTKQFNGYGKPWRVSTHSKHYNVDLSHVVDSYWVDGFDRNFTAACKKRLWLYCEQKGIDLPRFFICADRLPQTPWIDKSKVIKWSNVEGIKLPRKQSSGGSHTSASGGTYDAFVYDGTQVAHETLGEDELDTSMPVYYRISERMNATDYSAHQDAEILSQLEEGFTLVYITQNREKKFLRLYPEAETSARVIRAHWREWYDETLSAFERRLLAVAGRGRFASRYEQVRELPLRGVDDPDVAMAIKLTKGYTRRGQLLVAQAKVFSHYAQQWDADGDLSEALTDYPLCASFPSYDKKAQRVWRDHAVLYINSVYANNKVKEGR